jgi:hypothetical protein
MEPFIDEDGYIPETEKAEQGMGAAEWIQTHIYSTACIGAGVLLIVGALVVKQHVPASSGTTIQAWGGGGALVNSSSYDPQNPVLANLPANTFDNGNTISITPIPVTAPTATSSGTTDSFDMQGFIASLNLGTGSRPAASSQSASSSTTIQTGYDFIPQGLISVPTSGRPRTALQQALYTYGNDAGSYIQSYESGHQNTAPILTDQIADRQNKQKGQAVKDIGTALTNVGLSLKQMDSVPDSIKIMNQTLAQSYIDIGKKLSAIPDASGDDAFIVAIKTYDSAVESFTKNYVAVAQYLSLSGVTFSSIDPGSVFTFSGGGGL